MAKTYTAAGSAVAGDVYTAAAHNVIVTDINNTIVPPACVATAGATQNIVNTTYTALTFSAEQFDTDAIHDTSTNTSRFTVTTPGIYQMNAFSTHRSLMCSKNYFTKSIFFIILRRPYLV